MCSPAASRAVLGRMCSQGQEWHLWLSTHCSELVSGAKEKWSVCPISCCRQCIKLGIFLFKSFVPLVASGVLAGSPGQLGILCTALPRLKTPVHVWGGSLKAKLFVSLKELSDFSIETPELRTPVLATLCESVFHSCLGLSLIHI